MPELIEVHALHYNKGTSDKVWAYMVTRKSNMMFDWRAVWGKRTGPKMSKVMARGKSQAGAGEDAAKAYAAKRREGYTAIGNNWREPAWGLVDYIDALVTDKPINISVASPVAINQKQAAWQQAAWQQAAWQAAGRPMHVFIEGPLKTGFCNVCAFTRQGHGGHIATAETCDFCVLNYAYENENVQNISVQCVCGHDWYSAHEIKITAPPGNPNEHAHKCLRKACKCPHFTAATTGAGVIKTKQSKYCIVCKRNYANSIYPNDLYCSSRCYRQYQGIVAAPPAPTVVLPLPRRTPRSISHLLSDDL